MKIAYLSALCTLLLFVWLPFHAAARWENQRVAERSTQIDPLEDPSLPESSPSIRQRAAQPSGHAQQIQYNTRPRSNMQRFSTPTGSTYGSTVTQVITQRARPRPSSTTETLILRLRPASDNLPVEAPAATITKTSSEASTKPPTEASTEESTEPLSEVPTEETAEESEETKKRINERIHQLEEAQIELPKSFTRSMIDTAKNIQQMKVTRHDLGIVLFTLGIYTILIFSIFYMTHTNYSKLSGIIQDILTNLHITGIGAAGFDLLSIILGAIYVISAFIFLIQKKIENKVLFFFKFYIIPLIFLTMLSTSFLLTMSASGVPMWIQGGLLLLQVAVLFMFGSTGCSAVVIDRNIVRITQRTVLSLALSVLFLVLIDVGLQIIGPAGSGYYVYFSGICALFYGLILGLDLTIKNLVFGLTGGTPTTNTQKFLHNQYMFMVIDIIVGAGLFVILYFVGDIVHELVTLAVKSICAYIADNIGSSTAFMDWWHNIQTRSDNMSKIVEAMS